MKRFQWQREAIGGCHWGDFDWEWGDYGVRTELMCLSLVVWQKTVCWDNGFGINGSRGWLIRGVRECQVYHSSDRGNKINKNQTFLLDLFSKEKSPSGLAGIKSLGSLIAPHYKWYFGAL